MPKHKGFALLTPEARHANAVKAGRAAHASGHAHEWTPAEAARAGSKGGKARHGRPAAVNKTVSKTWPELVGDALPDRDDA